MLPTILIGDHVFVNKFAYRFNIPFTEYFGEPKTVFQRGIPERGEIVVFESPRGNGVNYIKRIVGLPGDLIRIRDRKIFINNEEVPMVKASPEEEKAIGSEMPLYKETLGSHEHWILLDKNSFVSENFGPYEVPEGRVFVMGDNRDFSDDSRFLGSIPIEKIRGRASWIWLSIWLHFDPYEFKFRPLRSGKSVNSL